VRLLVSVHGVTVGYMDREGGLTTFRFAPRYLDLPERPVLGRWYEDRLGAEFVEKSPQRPLPSFFENYLPEHGSALRELLARRAGVSQNQEFPLLAALGADLPGAIVVQAVADDDDEPIASPRALADPAPGGPLRFSLAGMQLKLSVAQNADRLTLPSTGVGGRFILKLPARSLPGVPENELSVMTWARAAGIAVPEIRLVRWRDVEGMPAELSFDEEQALLVARYDRPQAGGERVHQEDFAQVLGKRPLDKYGREAQVTYDRLGKIIAQLCGEEDFDEFLRRLVFMVLSANPDAHLKNWSLVYPDRRRPRLSPAYDLVSAAGYPSINTELALRLGGEWDARRLRPSHFGLLASHAGFDAQRGVEGAQAGVQQTRDAWKQLRSELPLAASQRDALDKHLAAMTLL
jgi:serine/threonine-protein kinase HipA